MDPFKGPLRSVKGRLKDCENMLSNDVFNLLSVLFKCFMFFLKAE